jgi:hypothetical protein
MISKASVLLLSLLAIHTAANQLFSSTSRPHFLRTESDLDFKSQEFYDDTQQYECQFVSGTAMFNLEPLALKAPAGNNNYKFNASGLTPNTYNVAFCNILSLPEITCGAETMATIYLGLPTPTGNTCATLSGSKINKNMKITSVPQNDANEFPDEHVLITYNGGDYSTSAPDCPTVTLSVEIFCNAASGLMSVGTVDETD